MPKAQPERNFSVALQWVLGMAGALIVAGIIALISLTFASKGQNDTNWARNDEQITEIRNTLSDIKASLPSYAKTADLALVSKRVDDCITKEDGDQRGKIRDMKEEVFSIRLTTDEAAIQALQAAESRRK